MKVKEQIQPSGNVVVIVHPLDEPLHKAAWEALLYLADIDPCECRDVLADMDMHTAHCRHSMRRWNTLVDNLREALAAQGVTADSIARFEETTE